ncbi:MAG: histidine--tRNA ligase [Pirellulales bacterium]|nr:histidine--tRNA ligase [Thermoguttaceae bacterium]MDD4789516.1 histidine--tRNA ligase [Pirellulales bacterium]
MARITPRTLKGFRDYLPEAMIPRERLVETARRVYRSYGFSPIDTPALEYLEVLAGKGGEESDKQLYKFQDHGGRWVGLRFDLTVPLARFAAQHIAALGTPLKRYHIAAVWRGENTQRGRYREFMQCDFDTIGTLSAAADIETALVIHDLFRAIGFEAFTIRLNNRMVLAGLLERLDLAERATPILRALDKLGKIGPAAVADEMQATAGATAAQTAEVLRLAALEGTSDEILSRLDPLVAGSERGAEGVARLDAVLRAVEAAGVAPQRLALDVSIARGLDYYTGTIYETFLDALPAIGSVCSGGRYDNLAELFTSQALPGIGASLGLDRLLAAMDELGMIEKVRTLAPVFIPYFDKDRLHDYLRLASALRASGIGAEVFPEPKRLGQQLKYADRRGFRLALIAGTSEFESGTCQLKDLAAGTQEDVSLAGGCEALVEAVKKALV